jgi:CheY-like chemotaxis protein/anti-sigma regulatory factor (Ser/Thr protein kinase)
MAHVLVVDDSSLDRRVATRILEEIGLDVVPAVNGKDACEQLQRDQPDLVVTDMQMPEMDGLQLVQYVTDTHPSIPIILMTAFGSEELAVKALQIGAASYVPKQNLARDLVGTVKNVLAVARARHATRAMLGSMTRLESEYVLSNSLEGLDALIGYVKEQLRFMYLFGEHDILRIGTSLYEAIVNAIEHGNLELSSQHRELPSNEYRRLFEQRGLASPYRTRHVYLTSRFTRSSATFVVRDQGKGFDPSKLPNPTDPENVGRVNGRGLFLIRTFMDEVQFNETGNEITMILRRDAE